MKIKLGFCLISILAFLGSGCGIRQTMLGGAPVPGHLVGSRATYTYTTSFLEEHAKFMAGFSKRKITPQDVQWLGGYLPGRLGLWLHADLWSKCLVIEDKNKNSVAVVSLDLVGLLPSDIREIQKDIVSFFAGEVLLHTTHTHSAPDTYGIWGFSLGVPLISGRDKNYISFLKREIAGCVKEANVSKAPAMLTFSQGQLGGITRGPRGIDPDISMNIMRVVFKDRSVLLLNYAIHPDMLYTNYVSPDLLYYTYDFLEKTTGSEVVYINGAIGGVQPIRKSKYPNRWERAREIGVAIGGEAIKVLSREKVSESDGIFWKKMTLSLPVENSNFRFASALGLMPEQRDGDGNIPVGVYYIRIGDAEAITFPGEAFPNIAAELKKHLRSQHKFVFGLTNGELGYLLFSQDFESGKYRYHSSVSLGSKTGDYIFEALFDLINQ